VSKLVTPVRRYYSALSTISEKWKRNEEKQSHLHSAKDAGWRTKDPLRKQVGALRNHSHSRALELELQVYGVGNSQAQGPDLVSSATNILPPDKQAAGNVKGGSPRPNPVALEVKVSVTGAKASTGNASRDLFTEETMTVLVFKDGAVIRLLSPVDVGQLLFLTSKKSNQEVVCQVLHRKDFQAAASYVELKFTEDRSDYWGVAFPEEGKRAPEFKVADQVRAEQVTAESPSQQVKPHRAEDVDLLKREVDALREQLASLQKKQVEEVAAKAMADANAARQAAVQQAAMRDAAKAIDVFVGQHTNQSQQANHKEQLAGVNDPAPEPAQAQEEPEELLMPAAPKNNTEPAPPPVAMSLPVWSMEKSPEEQLLEEEASLDAKPAEQPAEEPVEEVASKPPDETLPKPALDFTKMPKGAANANAAPRPVRPPLSKTRLLALCGVLVLGLVGGAWYGQWWKLLPIGNHGASVAAPGAAKRPTPTAPAAGNAKAATPSTTTAATNSTDAKDSPKADAGAPAGANSGDGSADSNSAASSDQPAQKSSNAKGKSKRDTAGAASSENPSSAEAVASDAPMVEPKLLKAANPVYPPDAMRDYITGDVKAEVTVEPSGHVGKVNVLSGPKALRDAAVEALKQYEYSPATQGGKAIESKTTEVVKFWFNP
jgi:TonB family protein